MTTPNEMRSAGSWSTAVLDPCELFDGFKGPVDFAKAIQADALSWAVGQIKASHSLEEAVMRLSLKYQELCKPKK